jgi:hypothetical protein
MSKHQSPVSINSPLIDYALAGLNRCWLPEYGRWSHIYHLDGRTTANESLPHSDVFYTLNVLLGCSRVQQIPSWIDVPETFQRNVSQLTTLPVRKYAFGVALWASAELGLEIPGAVLDVINSVLSRKEGWLTFRAQDLGMILSGVVAQSRIEPKAWSRLAAELSAFLLERYGSKSGLFYDSAIGARRRFASFATNTYLTLACYMYGEVANDDRFIEAANSCTRALVARQGRRGEWPWFFDAISGRILDFYEVYSVHQYGMAPAFLEIAERHGVQEARSALIKGFEWVLGNNQLDRPMLVPELNLTIRSQVRKFELQTNKLRMLRALGNLVAHREARLVDRSDVRLRLECRSYELGWILWSFGRRHDLPQLTGHRAFADALKNQNEA